ncbi:MAG TPA: translation initiation factor IF-2 N-terminal domain-containing protein, partial [Candidatus Melainabacteria bacterium]|nr:translation initiation factor IF-2 N-terminal domain-containing protein [Candidatus Melainabacteria bacterium]
MEERVRIYELSRKMNIPNQDIIQTLRELGYDVKSHSSTVDGNAVGLLIAALGKKKEDSDDASKKAPKTKATAKTTLNVPPPPEKKKDKPKPRVLNRYRKKPETPEGEGPDPAAAAETSQGPGLPAGGPAPLPASHISSTPRIARPLRPEGEISSGSSLPSQISSSTPAAHAGQSYISAQTVQSGQPSQQTGATTAQPRESTATDSQPMAQQSGATVKTKEPVARDVASPDTGRDRERVQEQEEESMPQVEPVQVGKVTGDSWSDESKFGQRAIRNLDRHFEEKQRKEQQKAKEQEDKDPKSGDTTGDAISFDPNDAQEKGRGKVPKKEKRDYPRGERGERDRGERTEKPMAPSVPIRVAAPSMRATPPRPPKSHRHSQVKKEQKKEEEKQKEIIEQELPKEVVLVRNLTVQELAEAM